MAVSPRRGRAELLLGMRKNRQVSPERTMVWVEPRAKQERKVPVVYYLCRNGQLEQPHFMEVPLSAEGLYLRDVMNRLNLLRGKGIASMYSWSSKRSYRNGYVWHDLSENDFIYPIHGHEYVLKGSEIVIPLPTAKAASVSNSFTEPEQQQELPLEAASSSNTDRSGDSGPASSRKIPDVTEYKVYKTEFPAGLYTKATDASTQTEDRKRNVRKKEGPLTVSVLEPVPTELNADEVSPPASTSSTSSGTDGKDMLETETLETLMKADGRLRSLRVVEEEDEEAPELPVPTANHARVRASTVLMQLISCGSMPADRPKLPLGVFHGHRKTKPAEAECVNPIRMQLEEREYFSGSLIETQRKEQRALEGAPRLKRSSSCNADR
ncbi:unnamed protein product [Victoria cruziana]